MNNMNKKIFHMIKICTASLILSFIGCGGKDASGKNYPKTNRSISPASEAAEAKNASFIPIFLKSSTENLEPKKNIFYVTLFELTMHMGSKKITVFKNQNGIPFNLAHLENHPMLLGQVPYTKETVQKFTATLNKNIIKINADGTSEHLQLSEKFIATGDKNNQLAMFNIRVQPLQLKSDTPIVLDWDLKKLIKDPVGNYIPHIYCIKNPDPKTLEDQSLATFTGMLENIVGANGSYTGKLSLSDNRSLYLDIPKSCLALDDSGKPGIQLKDNLHAIVSGKFSMKTKGFTPTTLIASEHSLAQTMIHPSYIVSIDLKKNLLMHSMAILNNTNNKEMHRASIYHPSTGFFREDNLSITPSLLDNMVSNHGIKQAIIGTRIENIKSKDDKLIPIEKVIFVKSVHDLFPKSTQHTKPTPAGKPDSNHQAQSVPDQKDTQASKTKSEQDIHINVHSS